MKNTITAVVVLALSATSCTSEQEPDVDAPAPVEVSAYTLKPEPLSSVTTYATRVQAFENAAIIARVEARVLERHVEGGEQVVKGQTLITLDPIDAELEVTQARATLSTAEAQLAEARRNFERGTELSKTGAIAAIELDDLTTKLEAAKAALKTAQAALEYAEVTLGYTRITAPIDGTVGLVNVSIGDVVGPSSPPVVTITRQDTVLVDVEVSESDALTYAQRLAAGEDPDLQFVLELPNGTTYDQPGTLFSTANTADPSTGTITARIAFPNPDNILLPGQSVRVLLSEDAGIGRLAVPQSAVQQDQRGPYVMVVGNDLTVSQRHLDLAQQVDDWWLVESGIEVGETVVINGLQKISSGSLISIAEAE